VREVKKVIVDQTSLLGRMGWNGEAAVEMVRLVRHLYQICGSWDLLEEMLLAQAERVKEVQAMLKEREEEDGEGQVA
jgi:hypothetical protein